jgi:hypothetical protein
MDPQIVRERAQAYCDALISGDIELAAEELSHELRSNLGSLVAILPLPLTAGTVESVDVGGSGYVAILRLTGDAGEIELQTRWKDRDGHPTIVEVSHVTVPVVEEAPSDADQET